jgi:hypothetical protein
MDNTTENTDVLPKSDDNIRKGPIANGYTFDDEGQTTLFGQLFCSTKINYITFNEAGYVECVSNILKNDIRRVCYYNWICSALLLIGLISRHDFRLTEISDVHRFGSLLAGCITGYITGSDFYYMTPLQKPLECSDYAKALLADLLLSWTCIIGQAVEVLTIVIVLVGLGVYVTVLVVYVTIYTVLYCLRAVLTAVFGAQGSSRCCDLLELYLAYCIRAVCCFPTSVMEDTESVSYPVVLEGQEEG